MGVSHPHTPTGGGIKRIKLTFYRRRKYDNKNTLYKNTFLYWDISTHRKKVE